LHSYYRNYNLYSYIFGVQTIVTIKQQATGGVELPRVVQPLTLGTLLPPTTLPEEMEVQQ